MRGAAGANSFSSPNCLPAISGPTRKVIPVMFPPGCARLVTSPSPTASALAAMTMGIVLVASLAAQVATEAPVTMISTLSWMSSATSTERRSTLPSANRNSITMFCPSTQPCSRKTCRNSTTRRCAISALLSERNPIRNTFPACCAMAASGMVRSAPATAPTKVRRSVTESPRPHAAAVTAKDRCRASAQSRD